MERILATRPRRPPHRRTDRRCAPEARSFLPTGLGRVGPIVAWRPSANASPTVALAGCRRAERIAPTPTVSGGDHRRGLPQCRQEVKGAAGDAKATAIYAEALARTCEFYSFYRSLEAYRASFSGGTTCAGGRSELGFLPFHEGCRRRAAQLAFFMATRSTAFALMLIVEGLLPHHVPAAWRDLPSSRQHGRRPDPLHRSEFHAGRARNAFHRSLTSPCAGYCPTTSRTPRRPRPPAGGLRRLLDAFRLRGYQRDAAAAARIPSTRSPPARRPSGCAPSSWSTSSPLAAWRACRHDPAGLLHRRPPSQPPRRVAFVLLRQRVAHPAVHVTARASRQARR